MSILRRLRIAKPSALIAAASLVALGSVAAPGSAAIPMPRPPGAAKVAAWDYYYGAAETQVLGDDYAKGASATFSVEDPKQVRNGHSLAEIAVESPAMDYSYIEAGWIVTKKKKPRLFIFWWDQGDPKCYDQGCGYVKHGPGIQPGSKLAAGTTLELTWQHKHRKWWLLVDGKRSGYYPDSQWTGDFSDTGFAQVFGEVASRDGKPLCADMGDGMPADDPDAATVTDVAFVHGPAVQLVKDVDYPEHHYTMELTGDTSMRYGGPGDC